MRVVGVRGSFLGDISQALDLRYAGDFDGALGSTLRLNAGSNETGSIWQPRFFDRALRTVSEYNRKVEYIHLNPVKAGLASRPQDWPWSSVHDYTGTINQAPVTPSGLSVDRLLLPADPHTRL